MHVVLWGFLYYLYKQDKPIKIIGKQLVKRKSKMTSDTTATVLSLPHCPLPHHVLHVCQLLVLLAINLGATLNSLHATQKHIEVLKRAKHRQLWSRDSTWPCSPTMQLQVCCGWASDAADTNYKMGLLFRESYPPFHCHFSFLFCAASSFVLPTTR